MPGPEIELLLAAIDRAYDQKSWHGPNLRGALRRVQLEQACWRPAPGRHNIWELAVHAAYWKYAVWRRLTGAKRGSFPLPGSNWFARPVEATAPAWRADLRLLDVQHRLLREAVAGLPAARLRRVAPGGKFTHEAVISGIAAHDVYHAGQIQLLKRLYRRA
jgi:hypothetical protein